jgi:hypothetical protein
MIVAMGYRVGGGRLAPSLLRVRAEDRREVEALVRDLGQHDVVPYAGEIVDLRKRLPDPVPPRRAP